MSLNYDLRNIHDFENVCWMPIPEEDKEEFLKNPSATYRHNEETGAVLRLNPVTDALIWSMLSLGVGGKITLKNVEDVKIQVAIHQRIFGPMLYSYDREKNKRTPRYVTAEEIEQHVGLSTNCFGKSSTKRAYKENIWATLQREALSWLDRKVAEVDKAGQEAA